MSAQQFPYVPRDPSVARDLISVRTRELPLRATALKGKGVMGKKIQIRDMKENKNINIPLGIKDDVFEKLGINPKTQSLMDVKKAIFELYGIPDPVMTVKNPRLKLAEQNPNNAFGIKITDEETNKFMAMFGLTDESFFQEGIGGRIVSDILKGKTSETNSLNNKASKAVVQGESELTPSSESPEACDLALPSERVVSQVSRIVRDTQLSRQVKFLHLHQCQICGDTIILADGSRYSEGHHIQPLGKPHDGPDILENIVCLCPNHHASCDLGAIRLVAAEIRCVHGHRIGSRFLDYHNERIYPGKKRTT